MSENPLSEEIKNIIRNDGPLAISKYMEMCLLHPQHGYYVKQDPLGRGGDFTTAPEISQIFGEIIGIWALDWWLKNKDIETHPLTLIELGPGRGSLMLDALRAIKSAAPNQPLHVHLVEASPTLTQVQKKTLENCGATLTWHTTLEELPATPALFIANEFFDALPIDQLILKDDMLYHHCVGLDDQDELIFGVGHPVSSGLDIDLGTIKMIAKAGEGTILEVSPHRLFAMEEVSKHIATNEGAGIIIDYGFAQAGFGDTFQAIEKHQYVHPLKNPGSADLTSHVDFPSLTQPIGTTGAELCGILTQGDFLTYLGINERAQLLKERAKDEKTKADIDLDCQRLTEKDQMGELFKVMILQAKGKIPPAPFSVE